MTDGSRDVSRRAFMRTATGATAVAAASGTAAAQENATENGTATGTPAGTATANGTEAGTEGGGGEAGPPDFGGYLDGVGNFSGSVTDARGQDTATVEVGVEANGGAFGFGPAAIHVDNGATVQFEWTGEGGGHNVVQDGGDTLDSGSATSSSGVNYEHTFEEDGIYNYYCSPHEASGMKGSIVVGTDYPTKSTGGGGSSTGPLGVPGSAKMLGVATSVVMVATLGMAYVFMRYGGDYEMPDE
ncbi:halocyanin domain-containing protein [Haloarcula salinisoli]|uniref:Halocyanin domain-containing protein n=1 Tax=Haloarcula salinisoli TaxID=2487746 RepID=A0A8J7YGB6_9EURY|nr:halocyanin domain-containing protein [Halomicroarcula salinisoli]MBX0285998.1 halocyanin domain-containing protein [Halomicroarcula salinisoli]MBX0302514.1 halocyanin domain-containing protein [Halomicroarcula salinisoli]